MLTVPCRWPFITNIQVFCLFVTYGEHISMERKVGGLSRVPWMLAARKHNLLIRTRALRAGLLCGEGAAGRVGL